MKKTLTLATVLALLAACSTPTAEPEAPQMGMTNLVDDESREVVRQALEDAGISDQAITEFFDQVDAFNNVVPTDTLTTGFEPRETMDGYDIGGMTEALTNADARLTNCRITTFTLARDILTVGKTGGGDTSQLFMDLDALQREPHLFDDDRQAAFETFYSRIPTTMDKDAGAHLADIQAYEKDHDITFADGPASIISVMEHDTIDEPAHMFVGHTGLLIDEGDNLLFIEKLAFEEPYQATWFANRSELNDYLMGMYNGGPDLEYAQSLILENGEVMDGYKAQ